MRVATLALGTALAFLLPACGSSTSPSVGASGEPVQIKVLSNRADLISGGDALVEVVLPLGTDPARVTVDVAGRDVTNQFALRPNGRYMGLVTGLTPGNNVLTARFGNGGGQRLTLVNHPIGGPVFSGPQVQPWICGTEENNLGPPQDAQCNAPTTYELMYRSIASQQFAAYDPDSPPGDVATTTTDENVTVPYIVRVETGTMNRGIYKVAVLFDPAQPWEPWAGQAGWNRKVMWLFGGGTASHYTQDPSPSPLDDTALSRGFMVATGGHNVHGNNSNDNVSAESVMMLKERIAETYGPIRYVIGEGCSGGGLQQHLIAAMYPGLLDGLIPTCSYPDVWTTATEVAACVLLNRYFGETSPQLWPETNQQAMVTGHSNMGPCRAWEALFGSRLDPSVAANCNLPAELVYNAQTNPGGARCTINDHMIAVLGPREPAVWGPVETQLGRGFANRPISNVGILFGLQTLLDGLILPDQFVDLNEKIGGIDIDGQFETRRTPADPGSVALAYRASLVSDARQLASVPIIDLRGHDDAEIHTDDWSYVIRARLDRHNGQHGNQIIFTGATPLAGDPAFSCAGGLSAGLGEYGAPSPKEACTHNPLILMDRWLAAIEADTTSAPLPAKVLGNRPAEAVDTCFIGGQAVTDPDACAAAFPHYSNPYVVAGAPVGTDNIECQLKPLERADFGSVTFTDALWARLQAVFPDGVCDYSKPAQNEQPSVPWLTYQEGPGGIPLGAPPVSAPL